MFTNFDLLTFIVTLFRIYLDLILKGDCMLYKRIRDLREDKDLTQQKMGEILSCSQRVYSNYERGELDIPTEILIKLADFHNVSVDYLLNRTNNKDMNI